MKRRDFIKLVGVIAIAPTSLTRIQEEITVVHYLPSVPHEITATLYVLKP